MAMTPRDRFLLAGAVLVVAALVALLAVATAYWPLQSVVQVIAPFLGLSIIASVGLSLIFTALLLPGPSGASSRNADTAAVIESLLLETRRQR